MKNPAIGGAEPFVRHGVKFYSDKPSWLQDMEGYPITVREPSSKKNLDLAYPYLLRVAHLKKSSATLYVEYCYKVMNKGGMERSADLRFHFFPPLESVEIHEIKVCVKGREYRVLAEDVLVHQVGDNEYKKILSNEWAVQAILNHVEIGAMVHVAYSINMDLSITDNIFSTGYALVTQDVDRLYFFAILADEYVKEHFKSFSDTPGSEKETSSGKQILWDIKPQPVPKFEANTLSYAELVPCLYMSTARDWAQISDWVKDYLATEDTISDDLMPQSLQKILDSKASSEDKLFEVIDWVKEKINYFSVAITQSGYFPRSPDTLLYKRWGDCKDKSFLLLVLLKRLGFTSWLALMDTKKLGDTIPPVPGLYFDHCLLYIKTDSDQFFVDPTDIYQLDPKCIADMANRQLLLIGHPDVLWVHSGNRIEFEYHLDSRIELYFRAKGEHRVKVKTEYRGTACGKVHQETQTNGSELPENYRRFLEKILECELEPKGFEIYEDPRRPVLICRETYNTETLWTQLGNQHFLEIIAYEIQSWIQENFSEKSRKLPMLVAPIHIRQKFVFLNGKQNPFRVVEEQLSMSVHGIDLNISQKNRYRGIEYLVELRTKPQIISPQQWTEVRTALEEIGHRLIFRLDRPMHWLERLSPRRLEIMVMTLFLILILLRLIQIIWK
ncbi:MAG: DUF3857 domain-containing protein [Candidatus Cloacimonetes bacterium]|nr:DUF3857 domain-containing protein [Candidatus Cloacimonadota bacterium]